MNFIQCSHVALVFVTILLQRLYFGRDRIAIVIVSWFKETGCYNPTAQKFSCDTAQYMSVPKQNYYFPIIPQLFKILIT